MNIFTKLILSIPSVIGIIYMFSYWSMGFFRWITNNIVSYEYQIPIVNGLILLQIGYLIFQLWGYKRVAKSIKTNWTILLVIFNPLSSLIYIWKKNEKFRIKEEATWKTYENKILCFVSIATWELTYRTFKFITSPIW